MKSSCLSVFLVLSVVLSTGIIGCGGGGGGDGTDFESASSASFSPMLATDSKGNETKLKWVYTVNNGEPYDTYTYELYLSLTFNDVTLIFDPSINQRTAQLSGKISGDVSGSYVVDMNQDFSFVGGAAYINSDSMKTTMKMSAQGESVSVVLDLLSTYSPAAEWFIDRDDLDQLPIGYTYDPADIGADVTGTMTITGYGTTPVNYYGHVSDSWVITGKQDSMTVQGRTYSNIVEVTRYTEVPNADGTENEDATYIYWVAKGIGWIKASGFFRFQNEPLDIELIETNLVVSQ